MKQPINERLKAVIVKHTDVPENKIVPGADLVDDLDFDSIGLVVFFMDLEEEFQITIHDTDAEKMMTVGEIEDYLHDKGKL